MDQMSRCCMRTLPTINSCPNSLDTPSHKLVTYPIGFGLLAQFGRPSMDDRLNNGSNESLGAHAVTPKNERQILTIDRRLSSSEFRASIAHEECRSQHTSKPCMPCGEQIW
jgi:hypothetical protein